MIRIAIVNDLSLENLRLLILRVPGYDVAWVARDGAEAVKKCVADRPDLVLMDPDIPGMDGIEVISRIMKHTPCPILIVTPTVQENAAKVFEALRCGALDAVNTPLMGSDEQAQRSKKAFLKKIDSIIKLQGDLHPLPGTKPMQSALTKQVPPLIVIGSSTGGPKTLLAVLAQLPEKLGATIIVVQHLDKEFSTGLADWLNAQIPMRVQVALEGERPENHKIYVAGTNDHLIITSNLTFSYTPLPRNNHYRPSVDVLFMSVAEHWPHKGCAILLTGMGRDGAAGLANLRRLGWHTIAQDEATSAVYGMPKAAKELDAAVEILPLEDISPAILRRSNVQYWTEE
jgi:two-component system response regulator WspF